MNETPPTPPTGEGGEGGGPEAQRTGRPRQLLRSSTDRMLGGVAGGLAEYFDIDPVLVRIAFAITGLMGIGLLAYLALFIFVPEDDGWGHPVQARDRDRLIAVGVALLLVIIIPGGIFPLASLDWWWGVSIALFWLAILAGSAYAIYWLFVGRKRGEDGAGTDASEMPTRAMAAPGAGPPGGTTPRRPAATGDPGSPGSGPESTRGRETSFGRIVVMVLAFSALALFSLFLAGTSAWAAAVGGAGVIAVIVILCGVLLAVAAFSRPMRWLIVPALALALPAAAVQAADFELEGGYGNRVIRPERLADIPEDGYKMAAGNMTIDLRQVDWRANSTLDLPAKLSFGRVSIIVPDDVCVASDIDVWAGGFEVLGESDSDFRVKYRRTLPAGAGPTLNLEGDVDIGWVEVLTRIPEDHPHGPHHGLVEPNASQPAHCLNADDEPRQRAGRQADRTGQREQTGERAGKPAKDTQAAGGRNGR